MDKVYQYIERNKWIEWLFFATFFWLVIVHLHLNRGLSDLIPGYHYWRKADTYAQILNYAYNGFRFFDHGIYFNQMASGGKGVAEFPLFYYLIAVQIKIFGNHLLVLKTNWLLIMFFGQFALYRTALHFIKNHILALAVPLVLFLSPTYVIYSIEFLPDPIAMHLGFIGLYFIVKHHTEKQKKWMIWALVMISISGMMKPFYLIPYIAYCMVLVIQEIIKRRNIKIYWHLIVPFGFTTIWFLYVNWYNAKHGSHYFLSKLMPIWENRGAKAGSVWERMQDKWLETYFNPQYLNVLIGVIVVCLVWGFIKQKVKAFYLLLCLVGAAFYFILLFGMLNQHDYYILPMLCVVPATALLLFSLLSNFHNTPIINYCGGLLVVVIIYMSLHFSWFERQRRLKSRPINATHLFEPYQKLGHFLLKNNVMKNDLVIAFSDKSPSYALMLLDRKGWSGFQTFYRREKVSDLIDLGAKYLIVNRSIPPKRDSISLQGVTCNYVADTNNIFIYKLEK